MDIYLIIFIITLVLSAFFSGAETAYVAANRLKIRLLFRQAENEPALLANDQRFLTTTLVGNNIVMVACSSIAVIVFKPHFSQSVLPLVTTIFLLMFGEILPKSIATQIPNRVSRVTPILLKVFYYPFFPIVWLAEQFSQQLVRLFNGRASDVNEFFSRMDLPVLMREMSTAKENSRQSHVFAKRVLRISSKRLQEVMIPRTEMIAVDKTDDQETIFAKFDKEQFSRLPVYNDTLDKIEGFYHILDLMLNPQEKPQIRPIDFFPESMTALHAMREMKKKRAQIAIVVNEHGGTEGMLSVEDLVEEVVGNIFDEFDDIEKMAKPAGNSTLITDARLEIDELRNHYHFNLPAGDYVTVAGLILHELGEIPEPGKKLEINGFKITILEADESRIRKVRIVKKEML